MPGPASAEVTAQVLPMLDIWLWVLLAVPLGFLAWRWRLWCGALASPVLASPSFQAMLRVVDPELGTAIRAELGIAYVASAFGSALVVLAACAAGAALRFRERQTRRLAAQ